MGIIIYGMKKMPSFVSFSDQIDVEVGTSITNQAFYEADMKRLQVREDLKFKFLDFLTDFFFLLG